jgi:hypothetical protein
VLKTPLGKNFNSKALSSDVFLQPDASQLALSRPYSPDQLRRIACVFESFAKLRSFMILAGRPPPTCRNFVRDISGPLKLSKTLNEAYHSLVCTDSGYRAARESPGWLALLKKKWVPHNSEVDTDIDSSHLKTLVSFQG